MSQARGVTVPGPDGFADPAEVQGKGVELLQDTQQGEGIRMDWYTFR